MHPQVAWSALHKAAAVSEEDSGSRWIVNSARFRLVLPPVGTAEIVGVTVMRGMRAAGGAKANTQAKTVLKRVEYLQLLILIARIGNHTHDYLSIQVLSCHPT